MTALRNTAIGLPRGAGETNIAAADRRFAAQPKGALELIGIQLENCMALTARYSVDYYRALLLWS